DSVSRSGSLDQHRASLDVFRQIVSSEIYTLDHTLMMMWSTWPATTAFMPEINRIYPSLEAEEAAVGEMLARAEKEGLSFPYKKFVAVTWGNEKSMILVDSVVLLSLNHYLGPLNEAYNGWPEYKRRLKTRDMITIDVSEAMLGTTYPVEPAENTSVLAQLLREGAMAVAKERLNPRAGLAQILGFTPEQLSDISQHESFIWKRLVHDKLLYSTDAEVKSELFDPRPITRIISQDAPGRAVRFIGYKIVKAYLASHPETSLKELMSQSFITDPAGILKESGYNPV
ncbi:MAG: hypothetical protein K2K84_06460, partial [Muribaculaceae bacterium]|nr:hypothetical protein [Muribaculaceae bacterium]